MRAALYCRISRDELGEGLGVDRQEQDCRALAERRGWAVGRVLVDNDVSAYSGAARPGYASLLTSIQSGDVDVVVAWAPERLHRSPRQLEDFIELVERTGTLVETVKAGAWDVSSSHGRLVARMLGAVSRAESERTGERVSRAHQQAKSNGRWRGPIPYGLAKGPQPGLPVLDENQAVVVQEVYRRVIQGDALTQIAADLNARGIRPRRGLLWTHTGIDRLIRSPALGGLVKADGELRPAAFDGVVDDHVWQEARAALRRRPRGEARRPREKLTLLGGLMVCDEHGHTCHGSSASHGAVYSASGPGKCHVLIKRAQVDEFVTDVVITRLRRPDARSLFQTTPLPHKIDREVADLRRRRDEMTELLAEGLLSSADARPRLQSLSEQLAALEAARTPPVLADQLFADPATTWSAWNQTQRREALRILFTKISLRHVGPAGGPRVNLGRLKLDWVTG